MKINRETNCAFETLAIAINIADICGSLPLLCLWIADFTYKGYFILKDLEWRSSFFCFAVFDFLMSFSFISPLFLCFLSLSRYRVVASPIKTVFKQIEVALKYCISVSLFGILLSISMSILLWFMNGTLPSNLCSPSVDPTHSVVLIRVLTCLTTTVQMAAIAFIVTCHVKLVISLRTSQEQLHSESLGRKRHTRLYIHLFSVTLCFASCWMPSGIIFLLALFEERVHMSLTFWTTAAIAPINSVVVPVVFIMTTSNLKG